MARPCKSAKVLTDKSQTIAEINARIEGENSLKGSGKLPVAPEWFRSAELLPFAEPTSCCMLSKSPY